jgi:hypothetical protein
MPSSDACCGPSCAAARPSRVAAHGTFSPSACVPAPGRLGGPVKAVAVDDDLVWVTAVPAVPLGAARAPSAAAFVRLCVGLADDLAAAGGSASDIAEAEAGLVDAAARVVAGYLDDLPDLPFVGEPFGGEEGTD